jgi:hypothetical protein
VTTEIWLAIVGGAFGGGGLKVVVDFLLAKATTNNAAKLASAKQPIDQYSQIVEELREQIKSDKADTTKQIDHLVEKLEKCTEHHLKCEREMGEIRGEVRAYRNIVEAKLGGPLAQVVIGDAPPIETYASEETDRIKLPKGPHA